MVLRRKFEVTKLFVNLPPSASQGSKTTLEPDIFILLRSVDSNRMLIHIIIKKTLMAGINIDIRYKYS